jgi:hypothetical protein
MIAIKILNCVHQGRRNQNTTFTIHSKDTGKPIELLNEEWVLANLTELKPIGVELQKNTSVKILYKR